jgi:hypothetical protein
MRTSFVWLYFLCAGVPMVPTAGIAGSDECCGRIVPKVVYGLSPVPTVVPPTG